MKKFINKSKFISLSFVTLVASLLMIGQANAAINVFEYDVTISGVAPSSNSPWLTATFDDSYSGANTVRLTMFASNSLGNESISEWYFNFDPSLDLAELSFNEISSDGVDMSKSQTGPFTGVDAYQADGDGLYDINFIFPPPPGRPADRFQAGETVVYDITYTSPIDVNSFNFFSSDGGGQGNYLSAAHVLNTSGGGSSGWVGVVPEPVSSTLFLVGAATLGFRRLRRNRKG